MICLKYKLKGHKKAHRAIYANDRFIVLMYNGLYPLSFFRSDLIKVKR